MEGRIKYEGNWKIGSRDWDGGSVAEQAEQTLGTLTSDIVEGIVKMKKREMENEERDHEEERAHQKVAE